LHPAAALREDHSRAAATSSRIPTKLHHPHHPSLKTRASLHPAALSIAPALAALSPALRPAAKRVAKRAVAEPQHRQSRTKR
jgi:hypothetical protein